MRTVNGLFAMSTLAVLSACSSPPKPAQPDWNTPAKNINTTLPRWSENHAIFPSPDILDHASVSIRFPSDDVYLPDIGYALAHSRLVIVSAPDGAQYFRAKSWLQKKGYSGVITFMPEKNTCLTCHKTVITFSR